MHTAQALYQADVPCPKYDAMYNKLLTDPDPQTEFYQYNRRLPVLYDYLTENTGEVGRLNSLQFFAFTESNN